MPSFSSSFSAAACRHGPAHMHVLQPHFSRAGSRAGCLSYSVQALKKHSDEATRVSPGTLTAR